MRSAISASHVASSTGGNPENFLFINVAFQLGFYLLLQLQTD